MTRIPYLGAAAVRAAVDPAMAVDLVRDGFVRHAEGAWNMPPKVYVQGDDGDFRAMPASGDGYALLKWVTSFPENHARGLPTVTGLVLLSSAHTGELRCLLDGGPLTALRTGGAAVVSAEALAVGERVAGIVGCGVNGRAVARAFVARGWQVRVWDLDAASAEHAATEFGDAATVATDRAEVLRCPTVATITPGHEIVIEAGALQPGQHVCLMGADGPGKGEMAVAELQRVRVVCDEWEQASHSGDIARAVHDGVLRRAEVTDLGAVLTGAAGFERAADDITAFDSTGLAVQDLAIARAVYERFLSDPDLPDVQTLEL